MGKINLNRVILGGLLAGVVINLIEGVVNGGFLEKPWADAMVAANQHGASTKQIIAFNVWGFAVGILTVWLYASLRSRFGAGPKTAALAGGFMWIATYALGVFPPTVLHVFPIQLVAISVAVELPEIILAAIAGAWLYKEEDVETPKVAAARA